MHRILLALVCTWTFLSVWLSMEAVASSRMTMTLSRRRARDRHSNWRWPADKLVPPRV